MKRVLLVVSRRRSWTDPTVVALLSGSEAIAVGRGGEFLKRLEGER